MPESSEIQTGSNEPNSALKSLNLEGFILFLMMID